MVGFLDIPPASFLLTELPPLPLFGRLFARLYTTPLRPPGCPYPTSSLLPPTQLSRLPTLGLLVFVSDKSPRTYTPSGFPFFPYFFPSFPSPLHIPMRPFLAPPDPIPFWYFPLPPPCSRSLALSCFVPEVPFSETAPPRSFHYRSLSRNLFSFFYIPVPPNVFLFKPFFFFPIVS